MAHERKTSQLQIRVSPREKAAIRQAAKRCGVDVSTYVLESVLSPMQAEFQRLAAELLESPEESYVFAAVNDFLSALSRDEFSLALRDSPRADLTSEQANYLAAMVEYAAQRKRARPPAWVFEFAPLREPYFGTELKSLRLALLLSSPLAFRRRNIFIDSSIGDRV